jgi:homoserine dehydrogenase
MTASASVLAPKEINVGLIGVGVVGSSVLDFFANGPMELPVPGARFGDPGSVHVRLWSAARRSRESAAGASEETIASIVSRDSDGVPRFYHEGDGGTSGPAWREVVYDDNVDVVVELTGSAGAEAMIEEALWNGKSVVTANKAVLSRTGYELVKLAQSRGSVLAYEAAVGGGMPIVQTIGSSIGGNITAILGILNGTSNFILSEMRASAESKSEGDAYVDAVQAAIRAGLAEADPSADVLGEDSRSKTIVLSGLGFGVRLRPRDVYFRGIARKGTQRLGSELNSDAIFHATDLRVLSALGYVPKLLAGAQIVRAGSDGERVVAWSQPAAVPFNHPLAGVDGSENACLLEVESPTGSTTKGYNIMLRGPGAGGPETASSVIADLRFCARQVTTAAGRTRNGEGPPESSPLYMYGMGAFSRPQSYPGTPSILASDDLKTPFLLRFLTDEASADIHVGKLLSESGLTVTSGPGEAASSAYHYFRTAPASLGAIERGIEAVLKAFDGPRLPLDVLYLPVLEGAHWDERGRQGNNGL